MTSIRKLNSKIWRLNICGPVEGVSLLLDKSELCQLKETITVALQNMERGRPGESHDKHAPELDHNGERTDCLAVGPRPPSAASPQQVAAGKQGNAVK